MKTLKDLTKYLLSLTRLKWKLAIIHLNVINYFLKSFLLFTKTFFPRKKIKLKIKDIHSLWVTSGIKKSSKCKQRLYEKILKTGSQKRELEYKIYENLLETIKKRSKKLHYSKLIIKYKAIGKEKVTGNHCQKKIYVEEKEITEIKSIAKKFNRYFTEIGPTFAKKVDSSSVNFNRYLEAYNIIQQEKDLTINKLNHAFFYLRLNKSIGYDEVSFNVIKKCSGSLYKPSLHIFNVSLQNGTFPDELKIARVTPLFKNGSDSDLQNYGSISVLPCFSKILEKVMRNRLYKHLSGNNVPYRKQFGF